MNVTEKTPTFFCEICDFVTSNKKDYARHLVTKKHKNGKMSQIGTNHTFSCLGCKKIYKTASGLWRHRESKKCDFEKTPKMDIFTQKKPLTTTSCGLTPDLICRILTQCETLAGLVVKQSDAITELSRQHTHIANNNVIHTNSHNNAFNLNFFLNETCKHAMNINDFIDSVSLQLSDFVQVGEQGFVQGLSSIIINKLNALDETVRPIHCTDQKRETFYVKDNDTWEKEDGEYKRIRRMIKRISVKNEQLMFVYKATYPDYKDSVSKRSDQYSQYVVEAVGGFGDDTVEKENKIIRNISRATMIRKKK